MKKLLAIIILSLCFITPSQADDIRDFQISGISVEDNLIDFFDKERILSRHKKLKSTLKSDKYLKTIFLDNSKVYDQIDFYFKKDKPYKIGSISGVFIFKNNIDKCYSRQLEVVNDIQKVFPDKKYITKKLIYENDPTKKSNTRSIIFNLASGRIAVNCVDWSPQMESKLNWLDNLAVTIETKEFRKWVNEKAYK